MWKKIKSKIVLDHKRLIVREDIVELPNKTKTDYLIFEINNNFITIICQNLDNKFLVQKEYVYPLNKSMYQLPGGGVNIGETLEEAVNRELSEESGYHAKYMHYLGCYYMNFKRSNSKMFIYYVKDLISTISNPEPEEQIENYWFTYNEITKMITNGFIVNNHFLATWTLFNNKKSNLAVVI